MKISEAKKRWLERREKLVTLPADKTIHEMVRIMDGVFESLEKVCQ